MLARSLGVSAQGWSDFALPTYYCDWAQLFRLLKSNHQHVVLSLYHDEGVKAGLANLQSTMNAEFRSWWKNDKRESGELRLVDGGDEACV